MKCHQEERLFDVTKGLHIWMQILFQPTQESFWIWNYSWAVLHKAFCENPIWQLKKDEKKIVWLIKDDKRYEIYVNLFLKYTLNLQCADVIQWNEIVSILI